MRFGWKQLACIHLGGVISLPLVMVGFHIGRIVPGIYGMVLCVLGNVLLAFLGIMSAPRIIARRCVTSQHVEASLGASGKKAMGILMATSSLLWFALQTQVVINGLLGSCRVLGYALFAACCALSLSNIHSIVRYAKIVAPLMALFIATAVLSCGGSLGGEINYSSFGGALAVAVGGAIVAIIDLPTFYKEALDVASIRKAVLAIFLGVIPLVECCGIYLAGGSGDVVSALSSSVFGRAVPLFLLLSGWMLNMWNLYSASKSIGVLGLEKRGKLIAAVGGITLTLFPLVDNFAGVMEALAIGGCAFGGLLLAEDCLRGKMPSQSISWLCLVVGLCVGLYDAISHTTILGVPILDVIASTVTTALIGKNFVRRKVYEEIS